MPLIGYCQLRLLTKGRNERIPQQQINSLDFVINRFFMKLFKTSNIRIVQLCQELFHFELPSVQLARRRKLFLDKFCVCV